MSARRKDVAEGVGARRLLAVVLPLAVLAAGLVLVLPDSAPTAEAHPPATETYTYEVDVTKTREVPVYGFVPTQVQVQKSGPANSERSVQDPAPHRGLRHSQTRLFHLTLTGRCAPSRRKRADRSTERHKQPVATRVRPAPDERTQTV